jgi:hypothetical protein
MELIKLKRMKNIIVLFLILSSFAIKAQDFENDMTAIISQMDSASSISMSIDVKLYGKKGGSKVYSSVSTVDYSQKGTISVLGDMETYISSTHEVIIDHEDKRILVQKSKKDNTDFSDVNLKEFKKLLKSENKGEVEQKAVYTLVSDNDGIKTYSCTGVKNIEESRFVLDTKKNKLLKVTYQYSEEGQYKGQYCELNYTKFEYGTDFSKGYFDSKKYFTIADGQYVISEKLNNYKLFVE